MDEAYKATTLPKSVNYEKINALYHSLYEGYHRVIIGRTAKPLGDMNPGVIYAPMIPDGFPWKSKEKENDVPLENKFSM